MSDQTFARGKENLWRRCIWHFSIWSLMLIPCCVSVRIQMVLVAPVRTSSSTNQIHVTHTEQKEERKWEERDRVEMRKKPERVRGVKIQQASISQTFFFFQYSANAKLHYVTIKSVEHSPPTHTHTHGLSAKKPLPNYLPLARALQPRSTILGPRVDKDRGQSDARRRGTFCFLSFKTKQKRINVWKEQVW